MKKCNWLMSGSVVMAALICLLGMDQAGAYDQDDLDRLLATNSCSNCNLRGANLSRATLSGVDMTGTNLSYANLIGANLRGADLSRADMSRADLVRADLRGAELRGANLTGVDLSMAIWTGGRQCAEDSIGECK